MHVLAVVPIFVNAGVAVLPIILGFIASHGAVLMRPREWFHIVKRHPGRAALWMLAASILIAAGTLGIHARGAPSTRAGATDWAQVARELIEKDHESDPPVAVASLEAPVNLRRAWRYNRAGAMFLTTPAVSDARVYVAGSYYLGNEFVGFLACLDIENGKPVWEVTHTDGKPLPPFASSPVLTPDRRGLLIGQGLHADHDCGLCCFDTATGALRWIVRSTSHIESTPAVRGDFSVVGVGAIEGADGKAVGDPGQVLAVRVSDGKLLWRQPLNDAESSPAIDNHGVVYIGSAVNGNAVVALRSESDAILQRKSLDRLVWRTQLAVPIASLITLVDDIAIAGGGNSSYTTQNPEPRGLVAALDQKTGAVIWQVELGDSVLGDIAAARGTVFCPVRTGEVVALEQATGKVLWRTPINNTSPVLSGCVFRDGRIYAMSNDGVLAILDAQSGEVTERIIVNSPTDPGSGYTFGNPVVSRGRVIVATETGGVQCLVGNEGAR